MLSYSKRGDAHTLEDTRFDPPPRLAHVVEDYATLEQRRERRRAAGEEGVAVLAVERVRLVVDRPGDRSRRRRSRSRERSRRRDQPRDKKRRREIYVAPPRR